MEVINSLIEKGRQLPFLPQELFILEEIKKNVGVFNDRIQEEMKKEENFVTFRFLYFLSEILEVDLPERLILKEKAQDRLMDWKNRVEAALNQPKSIRGLTVLLKEGSKYQNVNPLLESLKESIHREKITLWTARVQEIFKSSSPDPKVVHDLLARAKEMGIQSEETQKLQKILEEVSVKAEPEGESEDALYCICKKPADNDMIGCDECQDWFHMDCVSITPEIAENLVNYVCPSCCKNKGIEYPHSKQSPIPRKIITLKLSSDQGVSTNVIDLPVN